VQQRPTRSRCSSVWDRFGLQRKFSPAYHRDSLRALHSGHQDHFDAARAIFIFHFYHSGIDACCGSTGVTSRAANLGFLFTSMAIGSVISSIFIIPAARSRYSPQRLTTYANASLIVVCPLIATIRWTHLFLVVAALASRPVS
jgi:hypothetical protein